MHKREMCFRLLDADIAQGLAIRELPTGIPFQIHAQLCCYILVVVVSHTYPEKRYNVLPLPQIVINILYLGKKMP